MSKVNLKPFEGMVHPNYLRAGFHVYGLFPVERDSELHNEIAKKLIGRQNVSMTYKSANGQRLFAAGFGSKRNADAFFESVKSTEGITAIAHYAL